MTYRHRLIPPMVLLVLSALTACDDGAPTNVPGFNDGGGGVIASAEFEGIWNGIYIGNPPGDPEQWDSTFTTLVHDGHIMMFEDNGQLWDGFYVANGAAAMQSDEIIVFRAAGLISTRIPINGNVSNATTLDVSYDTGQFGLIQMQFIADDVYQQDASLSLISGNWSGEIEVPVVIEDDGEFESSTETVTVTLAINNIDGRAEVDGSSSSGCQYNGVIELIDPEFNLYDVTDFVVTDGTLGACDAIIGVRVTDQQGNTTTVPTPFPFAGDGYSGFATLLPDEDSLLFGVTNTGVTNDGNELRSVVFSLTRS